MQLMDEWNFENWGIKYWSKTQEFIDYMEQLSFMKRMGLSCQMGLVTEQLVQ